MDKVVVRAGISSSWNQIERNREDHVDAEQLQPFEPVALAVERRPARRANTERPMAVISKALKTSDIGCPNAYESSTSTGATISAICALLPTQISSASVISLSRAARDGAVVLGGVADERDDDHAGEELRHAEPVQRRLQRARRGPPLRRS